MTDSNPTKPPLAKPSLGRVIEVLVYAPLGIGLYLRDVGPGVIDMLVARGRAEIDHRQEQVSRQVTSVRSTGEVALAFGLPMVQKRLRRHAGEAKDGAERWLSSVGGARANEPAPPPKPARRPPPAPVHVDRVSTAAANGNGSHAGGVADRPATSRASGDLAIPGYDALSASQVVERLVGLGAEELSAVRAYEASHRNRRTILGKIDQLTA